MSATKLIKQIMIERNISVKDLAEKLDIKPQSMSNKFHRDSFSFNEVVKILDILDCDITIVTRDTEKIFK
ncbi:helix-turn-helix domain-containing protein [Intestinibacter sp.]